MTTQQISRLKKLPGYEKIMLAQWLWEDVARENLIDELPEEHRKILLTRIERMNSGKTKFKTWKQFFKGFHISNCQKHVHLPVDL